MVYSSGKDILDQNTGFAAANHQLSRRCHRPPPDKKEGKTTLLPLMRLFFFLFVPSSCPGPESESYIHCIYECLITAT